VDRKNIYLRTLEIYRNDYNITGYPGNCLPTLVIINKLKVINTILVNDKRAKNCVVLYLNGIFFSNASPDYTRIRFSKDHIIG